MTAEASPLWQDFTVKDASRERRHRSRRAAHKGILHDRFKRYFPDDTRRVSWLDAVGVEAVVFLYSAGSNSHKAAATIVPAGAVLCVRQPTATF